MMSGHQVYGVGLENIERDSGAVSYSMLREVIRLHPIYQTHWILFL